MTKFEAITTICRSMPLGKSFNLIEYCEALDYLRQELNITSDDAVVLSVLFYHRPCYFSIDDIREYTNLEKDEIKRVIKGCLSSGMIAENQDGYILQEKFYQFIDSQGKIDTKNLETAIQKSPKNLKTSETAFHKKLLQFFRPFNSFSNIEGDSSNILLLVNELKEHEDLEFAKGYRYFNLDSQNYSIIYTAFLMCYLFIKLSSKAMRRETVKKYLPQDVESALNDSLASLVTMGFLDAIQSDTDKESGKNESRYSMSYLAVKQMFNGTLKVHNYAELALQCQVVRHDSIKAKNLYYDSQRQGIVDDMRNIFSTSMYESIRSQLAGQGLRTSISCVLYGDPGSGKTELAKQLARETQRDLVIADISKMESMWVGASEKNFRELFRCYKHLVAASKNFPILLFNEADAILGKRTGSIMTHHDMFHNRLQNILLEELENMDGILIATTNFSVNLDEAFERRFVHKLHLEKPSSSVLASIWIDKMPDLSQQEAEYLAESFNLTGAQIDNIIAMKIIREAVSGRKLLFNELVDFCSNEQSGFRQKDLSQGRERIGF